VAARLATARQQPNQVQYQSLADLVIGVKYQLAVGTQRQLDKTEPYGHGDVTTSVDSPTAQQQVDQVQYPLSVVLLIGVRYQLAIFTQQPSEPMAPYGHGGITAAVDSATAQQ